jgi:uncharacterized membrane protein
MPVTVVGAMVLGPEFGPPAAVAAGVVLRRRDLLTRGATAIGVGFPVSMAITALAAVLLDLAGLLSAELLDDLDQVDFTTPSGRSRPPCIRRRHVADVLEQYSIDELAQ